MTDGRQECFACGDPIADGDWVVPLETFEARYHGEDFVLNADNTLETIIHATCLEVGPDGQPQPETATTSATMTATPRVALGEPLVLDSEAMAALKPGVAANNNEEFLRRLYEAHDGQISSLYRSYPFSVSQGTIYNRLEDFGIHTPSDPDESDDSEGPLPPSVDEESFRNAVELSTSLQGVANILREPDLEALKTAVRAYGLEDELLIEEDGDSD